MQVPDRKIGLPANAGLALGPRPPWLNRLAGDRKLAVVVQVVTHTDATPLAVVVRVTKLEFALNEILSARVLFCRCPLVVVVVIAVAAVAMVTKT